MDPWGQIVTECPKYADNSPDTDQSIGIATIDLNLVRKVREEMPVFSHRRNDIYNLNLAEEPQKIEDSRIYQFADKAIPGKTVFLVSQYSFAFTNIRCVVPGRK